jgi:hypothetical protein
MIVVVAASKRNDHVGSFRISSASDDREQSCLIKRHGWLEDRDAAFQYEAFYFPTATKARNWLHHTRVLATRLTLSYNEKAVRRRQRPYGAHSINER